MARLEKEGVKTDDILGAPDPAWTVRWKQGLVFGQPMAVSPKGDLVARSDTTKIVVYSTVDGKEVTTIAEPDSGTYGLAFSPDGERLAGVGVNDINKTGGKIWLWKTPLAKRSTSPPKKRRSCFESLSPDGKVIAALLPKPKGLGQTSWLRVAVLDASNGETKQVIETNHKGGITGIVFSADSKKLATVSVDTTACVWEWETGKLLATCKLDRQGNGSVSSIPTAPVLLLRLGSWTASHGYTMRRQDRSCSHVPGSRVSVPSIGAPTASGSLAATTRTIFASGMLRMARKSGSQGRQRPDQRCCLFFG